MNSDGSDDTSFGQQILMEVGQIRVMSILADGRILLGGSFPSLSTGGNPYLARLNADGTLDTSFAVTLNGPVDALAPQANGDIVLGGRFTRLNGRTRIALARISQSEPVTDTLGVSADRTTIIWSRSGPAVDLSSVVFEQSTDGRTFTVLAGTAVRMNGTADWQLNGLSLPETGSFYIRARGVTITSAGKSTGIHEVLRQFNYQSPFASPAGSGERLRLTE
jgi:hypothetical protein